MTTLVPVTPDRPDHRNIGASPTKEALKGEVSQLRTQLQSIQQQAYDYVDNQQQGFQRAAEQFQQEARDVTQAEIATGEARVQADMHNRMQNAEGNLIARAEDALQSQHQNLANQAEQIIGQESQKYAAQERQELIAEKQRMQLEAEAEAYVSEMWAQAEGHLKLESKMVRKLKGELGEAHQRTKDIQASAHSQAANIHKVANELQPIQAESEVLKEYTKRFKLENGRHKQNQVKFARIEEKLHEVLKQNEEGKHKLRKLDRENKVLRDDADKMFDILKHTDHQVASHKNHTE